MPEAKQFSLTDNILTNLRLLRSNIEEIEDHYYKTNIPSILTAIIELQLSQEKENKNDPSL